MSSLEERLEAAMCPDSTIAVPAQHELVAALLGRRFQRDLLVAEPPTEQRSWTCSNCLRDWPENYCQECGRRLGDAEVA